MTHTPTPAHQPGMTGGSMSEHGPDWTDSLSGEPDSCRCGYNGTSDECAASRATEATDPTPGEVGLTTPRSWPENAWPTAAELADWLSRCTHDERLSYADHSIATAQRAARCVDENPARTADLRAKHAAEVEALQRDRDLALASAASMDHFAEVAERVERRNNELARERDEFREASEERAAAAEAAEAREAHIGSREFASTLLGEWVKPYYGDDSDDAVTCLHRALRAALTTPPTTEGSK